MYEYKIIFYSLPSKSINKKDIDYFASQYNAKLPHFYSRLWCNGTLGVDAFSYDWSKGFGLLVPPITLIPRVLGKMNVSYSRGVLVVPEWKSAALLANVMFF